MTPRTLERSEMPNGKIKKKIGTFLLYSYFFFYNPCASGCLGKYYLTFTYVFYFPPRNLLTKLNYPWTRFFCMDGQLGKK